MNIFLGQFHSVIRWDKLLLQNFVLGQFLAAFAIAKLCPIATIILFLSATVLDYS